MSREPHHRDSAYRERGVEAPSRKVFKGKAQIPKPDDAQRHEATKSEPDDQANTASNPDDGVHHD
jgi:hypothetical protein